MAQVSLKYAALVTLLASVAQQSSALPSADSLKTDLNLIFQNDLYCKSRIHVLCLEFSLISTRVGPTASVHQSTILLSARSNSEAVAACAQLGEGLLQTNGTYFKSDIEKIITYRELLGNPILGQYWVASSKPKVCEAVSNLGVISLPCNTKLPAFCSNSAPNKPGGQTDLSSQYQVQVNSGKFQVQG